MRMAWRGLGFALVGVFAAGCAPDRDLTGFDGGTGCETVVAASLGLNEIYDQSFDQRVPTGCASSGCHGTGAGHLTFRSARELWAATVNQRSRAWPAMNLVTPGDLSNSYLYWKLHPDAPRPMPEGGPFLDPEQLAAVAAWICAGAPEAEPSDAGPEESSDAGTDGPVVTVFAPLAGVAGTPVTVTGEGFSTIPSENVVTFAGTPAQVETATATTLTTSVPAGASTGPITVEVAGLVGTSAEDFQVIVPHPAPELTAVAATTLLAGSDDAVLEVQGAQFVAVSVVQWDGATLPTTLVDATWLQATVPAARLELAGEHAVTVLTPGPGGGTSATSVVGVIHPAPTLTMLAPSLALAGAATPLPVELAGTGFVIASQVTINGAAVPAVPDGSTKLTVSVPPELMRTSGTLSFQVTNPAPGGGASATVSLPVHNPAPALASVSPNGATAGVGEVALQVEGTGFTAASVVALDGALLPTTFVSQTRVEARGGASVTAASGEHAITVTNPAPGGGQRAVLSWNVVNAQPTVSALDPTSVAVDGAPFELRVQGTGFVAGSTVQVDGAPRPTRLLDATRLVADLDTFAATGTRTITVVSPAPGGGTSNAATLSVVTSNTPMITGLTPALVATDTAFELVVTGSGFACSGPRPSTLLIGATSHVPTSCTATRLTLEVAGLAAGAYEVTVRNGPGQTSNSRTLSVIVPNPAPVLSSLSPSKAAIGSAGFTLTATGTGFVTGALVSVDGEPRSTRFVDASRVDAQLLASDLTTQATLSITVTNPEPGGGLSAPVSFPVVDAHPVPVLSSLSPSSVPGSSGAVSVTLAGSAFLPSSQATFDGEVRATTYESESRLLVELTDEDIAAVGAHTIAVLNPAPGGGTSNAFTFTVVAANPLPVLLSLSPAMASAGSGTLTLAVTGEGFVSTSSVRFDGTSRPTSFVSDTRLEAAISATDLVTAGEYPIQVMSPAPGGGTSSALPFLVNNPLPTVGSISPSTVTSGGAAFTLNVLGSGFVGASVVRVDGIDRPTSRVNSTQLAAQISAGDVATVGSRAVTVFNPTPGGGSSQAVPLIVANEPNPVPVVTTLSPCGTVAGSGPLTLTVTGSGFVDGATLTFNGTSVPVTLESSTRLTATVPASALAAATVDNAAAVVVSNPSPGGGPSAVAWFGVATRAVTLATDVQPIFTASCATSGCHAGNRPSGDLALTSALAYDQLVGVASAGCSNRKRVLACGPRTSQSDLVAKVLGRDLCGGSRMPKSASLPPAQLQVLIDWVAQGAPR